MNTHFEMNEMTDEQIAKEFKVGDHWGLSVGIDLERCNMDKINDPEMIEQFVIGLCDYIKMRQFGKPTIIKFGNTPKLSGYTLLQLIETSSITAHFKDFDGNAFIDIFSCRSYHPRNAAQFCKKFFNAQKMTIKYISYRD
jgi:S-adenosylmethionine/arginine decarboxylase-like enzyme